MKMVAAGGSDPIASNRPVVGLILPGGGAECAAQAGAATFVAEQMTKGGMGYVGGGGASGGGLNLGFLTQGWVRDRGAGVADQIERLWWNVGQQHPTRVFNWMVTANSVDHSPGLRQQTLPPAPYGKNAIEWMVEHQLDFDLLRHKNTPTILINSVLPLQGLEKVTLNPALTPQTFAASSALPSVFNSVNIGGRPHWDGGLVGTPIDPLYRLHPEMTDLIVIPPLPSKLDAMPAFSRDREAHMRNLMWNANLQRELYHIMNQSMRDPQREQPLRVHMIDVSDPARNPMDFSWPAVASRLDKGYETASKAWQGIAPNLNVKSTYIPSYEIEGFPEDGTIKPRPRPKADLRAVV